MKVASFMELRNKIRRGLIFNPETSGGEVLSLDTDPDSEDLLVTWQYADGQRTHRITITDETANVPRETSPDSAHQRMLDLLAESDRIIAEQGLDVHSKMSPEEWDVHMQEIARRAVTEDVDVPRETSE